MHRKRVMIAMYMGAVGFFIACICVYGVTGENIFSPKSTTYDFWKIPVTCGFIATISGYIMASYMFMLEDVADIDIHGDYPVNVLSNLAEHTFVFDGVVCMSMESLLQSFKVQDKNDQVFICGLSGEQAKRVGSQNDFWKDNQELFWQGKSFERGSLEYHRLLDAAFEALARNQEFKKALLETRWKKIICSTQKRKIAQTVLTEQEFCFRLTKLRSGIVL